MKGEIKNQIVDRIRSKFGLIEKLPNSNSLFFIPGLKVRLYFRYSKIHGRNQAFYGLRALDLRLLEGFNSFICFLNDSSDEPILIPFSEFEEIFHDVQPADDGQYKVSIFFSAIGVDLYIAKSGRYDINSYMGWSYFDHKVNPNILSPVPDFTHSQMQSLLGSIGSKKQYNIWIPLHDRTKLDWDLVGRFDCSKALPYSSDKILSALREIDVIWIERVRCTPSLGQVLV